MDARQKAVNLLGEIIAIENYTQGFALKDYGVKEHASHLQKKCSQIMETMFKELYGNGDEAASKFMLLIMTRQIAEMKMSPGKLQEFVNGMLPRLKTRLQQLITQMDEEGEGEEEDGEEDGDIPFNPQLN